jgi:hypothetical protein
MQVQSDRLLGTRFSMSFSQVAFATSVGMYRHFWSRTLSLIPPPHDAEQRTRKRIERALVDGLSDREHVQAAPENLPDLVGGESVWPLLTRLEVGTSARLAGAVLAGHRR